MIVTIEEIGKSGLSRTQSVGANTLNACLREAGVADWSASAEGVFDASFEKVGRKVLMKGRALVHLCTVCKRCLEPVPVDLHFEFMVNFVSASTGSSTSSASTSEPKQLLDEMGTGASFDLSSSEEEPFDGRTIDTEELFKEQLFLNLPMGLVCREECKGLCSICGEQLNERECGCDRRPLDPRWEALRAIKLEPPKA